MIKFDSFTLNLFAKETYDFFKGARIRKIRQPGSHELVFDMRNKNENRKLCINFNPEFHHLCFMSEENEKKRRLITPKAAPMFCMLLRKYILNARITDICVPEYERIFEIYFEYLDELGEKSELCLAIELMGKYSNVILYNCNTNVIIGCAHNVGAEKSRERELCGLLPYVYPKKQNKTDITECSKNCFMSKISDDDIVNSTVKSFAYVTIPFLNDLINLYNIKTKDDLYDTLTSFFSGSEFTPYIKNDYSEYSYLKQSGAKLQNSINDMIDNYFSYHIQNFIKRNFKSKTLHLINKKCEKLYSLKKNREEVVTKKTQSEEYKNKADLIMTYMYKIKKGDKTANVFDFNGEEIIVTLDENKSPVENANRYYELYRKTKTAYEYANTMLKETESEILYFEELKYFAQNSDDIDEIEEIYNELSGDNTKFDTPAKQSDYIEYKGYRIYFGKNKKQNDELLSKIAAPEDLWFHPLNFAGSHVILKVRNSKEIIPDDVILKAAQITKEYSSQKNNSKTCIIYTKRKYLKKANNKQAFVTYKNETEIIV